MSNIQKFRVDLEKLILLGDKIRADTSEGATESLLREYQNWYTESHIVIKQLLPDRLEEFERLYKGDGQRPKMTEETYNIQDWLNRIVIGRDSGRCFVIAANRFLTQLAIVESVKTRFDSSLFEIRQLVQADLFDSELDAARELTKQGFLRAAGAVAGVVLEKHLSQVADNHNVETSKKNPTINHFNERLKVDGVLDVPTWRQIQRLGDIRNLCDHHKQREPTKEEVDELIDGVEKYTKTLF